MQKYVDFFIAQRRLVTHPYRPSIRHFHYAYVVCPPKRSAKEEEQEVREVSPETLEALGKDLKGYTFHGGRLARTNDDSVVYDETIRHKMQEFYDKGRKFISSRLQSGENQWNIRGFSPKLEKPFNKKSERVPLTFNSLSSLTGYLGLLHPQRKELSMVTRHNIRYDMWCLALETLLKELEGDLQTIANPSERVKLTLGCIHKCLQLFASNKKTDWTSLDFNTLDTPKNDPSPDPNPIEAPYWKRYLDYNQTDMFRYDLRWGEVLDQFDLIAEALTGLTAMDAHLPQVMAMREGLFLIRDIRLDNKLNSQELKTRDELVTDKLRAGLGHNSHCLFILMTLYLFHSVRNVSVDFCGSAYFGYGKNFHVCMGDLAVSAERDCLWKSVKNLNMAMQVAKYALLSAKVDMPLKIQGHLWALGANECYFEYQKFPFYIHPLLP